MRLKLRMASVRYIHTQRFVSETLAFVQHFNQLQDVLGRSRAASAGQKVRWEGLRQISTLPITFTKTKSISLSTG